MAPIKAITESICAALGPDCTSATVTTLSDYLLPKSKTENTRPTTLAIKKTQGASRTQVKTAKAPRAKLRTIKAGLPDAHTTNDGGEEALSPKERSILATEVINATLKSLSDAIRAPLQPTVRRQACSREGPQRKTLRRSISMPQVPLQSPSLNRVASSSSLSNRSNRSSSNASMKFANHRPTAECARIAFACLRSLQAAGTTGVDFPPLQLENGTSALIGKLLALGLDDLALKEVRILRRKLDPSYAINKSTSKTKETQLQEFRDLLNFGDVSSRHDAALGLIISTQLHVVRLLASTKKENIRAALDVLQPSHRSSPARLILLTSQSPKSIEKAVRQLQVLSDTLLSLSPSVSSSEDDLALEIGLSAPPDVAFQLQAIALHIRLLWWDLANHKADYEKDFLSPLYRCLSTFARRSRNDASLASRLASESFQTLQEVWPKNTEAEGITNSPVLFDIHRLLSSLSQEAGDIDTALCWTRKLNQHKGKISQARKVFIATRLVSLSLRRSGRHDEDEPILAQFLDLVNAPYAGTSSDIEDLITEISGARRVALAAVSRSTPTCSAENRLEECMRQMCESLILLCPRVCLRYLGASTSTQPATKDIILFEQKRLFIAKSAQHTIDSTLFLIKALLSENRSNWDLLDSKLQECLLLLDRLGIDTALPKTVSTAPQSYYVKISNLYFTYFLNERRNPEGQKQIQQLQVLRRSVDCIGGRSSTEKKAAMYTTKLERMADIYKTAGRYHELFEVYKTIQGAQTGEGVLSRIALAISTGPLRLAWETDEPCALLGRTVHILLKIQVKYLQEASGDLAVDESLPKDEQGAILEHQLVYLRSQARNSSIVNKLQSMVFDALLALYDGKWYPLRRLRVLMERLNFECERQQGDVNKVCEEIALVSSESVHLQGSQDCELQRFWVHQRTLALSTLELQQQHPQVDLLKGCINTWSIIEKDSKDSDSLQQRVEDTAGLVNHLENIGIYCQIKGQDDLRVTVLSLIADLQAKMDATSSSADDVVSNLADLAAQWLKLGYSKKAGFALDKAQRTVDQSEIAKYTALKLYIRYSDYLQTIGNLDKSEEYLSRAKALYLVDNVPVSKGHALPKQQTKSRKALILSDAYLVHSKIALARGAAYVALSHAKQAVRLLRRAWAAVEEQKRRKDSTLDSCVSDSKLGSLTEGVSNLNLSVSSNSEELTVVLPGSQSCLWVFITPLFHGLQHLSTVYAYHGMFQETIYYAEQGYKLAKDMESAVHQSLSVAAIGSILMKAGCLERGSEMLLELKSLSTTVQGNQNVATLAYCTGKMHGILGDQAAELASYELAESTLEAMMQAKQVDKPLVESSIDVIEDSMAKISISQTKTTTRRKPAPHAKAPTRVKKTVTQAKTPTMDSPAPLVEECAYLVSFRATILRSKALVLQLWKRSAEAQALLDRAAGSVHTQIEALDHRLAMAKQLLFQSMDRMTGDPVYSILQDSTISFPSISSNLKENIGDRLSIGKVSPPRKANALKSGRGATRLKASSSGDFFEKLQQAQEYLLEAHTIAIAAAPVALIHTISALLNSVSILLSVSGYSKGKAILSPGFATCTIETARTTAMRRERKAILSDPSTSTKVDESVWPKPAIGESRRTSLAAPQDLSRFQKEYIDIIPQSWTAISIALSDDHNELVITRLQAGQTPFVLRLPLGKHISVDVDEEVFGFEQGRCELQEIIESANESAHNARDMTGKDAKMQWWEEREALDTRMKELLENIEKVWLGGFTGIFSQQPRKSDLLARFQKSFQNILDKHLPSRQKTGKRGSPTTPRVTLDPRILELFTGLGDAADEDSDFSEPLTDLLYFVVDILQFHGELNAYAEIDFDLITIETHDALRCYHEALRSSNQVDGGKHTILILDKALHAFPWESLPCMNGQAVSRLPSLGCLRDRILIQRGKQVHGLPDGHYIDRSNGSYILNPGGDLKNTQATFQKPLQSMNEWTGIVKREPKEEEIKESLLSRDLFLYFGHGSGAQYIRAREIRKLEKCSVTFLMGCSSGTLVDAAEFEAYGPAINYMHAGCPALVATLWDVTDKDIDRFAKSTFEAWGLFGPECSNEKKGKGKKKVQTSAVVQLSLVEAVAKGREACNLRYLNAAAVCVYGVPVYLK